ncbi:MAG: carbohydrate ABC transporter permease [Vicinamibacterales bacterium]
MPQDTVARPLSAARVARRALVFVLLGAWTGFAILPFVWALATSLKTPAVAFAVPTVWRFEPTLDAYRELWSGQGFDRYLFNSLSVAIATVVISLAVATPAAYALARSRKGSAFSLLIVALVFRALPRMAFVLPFYYVARATGLYDTRVLLVAVLVAVNQPFTIWMLRGFFREVPREIDEAALVDGCTPWQAFFRAVLPVAKPGLLTAALFTLLLAYNEFLLPVVLTATGAMTLPVAISQFGAENIKYWSIAAAGSVSIALPIVVLILVFQRQFVRGLTAGAVKG